MTSGSSNVQGFKLPVIHVRICFPPVSVVIITVSPSIILLIPHFDFSSVSNLLFASGSTFKFVL